MIKLSEEGMSKAQRGQKRGLLSQTAKLWMNAKEKFLREIESTTSENRPMIWKGNSFIADMEKVLSVWIEDQASHNIPFSQSLIQSKALTLHSRKAERDEEAVGEKLKTSRNWLVRFKGKSCLHNIKVQSEAASTDAKPATRYPEDLAKIINEGATLNHRFFNVDKAVILEEDVI